MKLHQPGKSSISVILIQQTKSGMYVAACVLIIGVPGFCILEMQCSLQVVKPQMLVCFYCYLT